MFMNGDLDFSAYWQYAFRHWLSFNPPWDMDAHPLSPDEGTQLANLLPSPNEIMEWLVFRDAKSAPSSVSSTGDQ